MPTRENHGNDQSRARVSGSRCMKALYRVICEKRNTSAWNLTEFNNCG